MARNRSNKTAEDYGVINPQMLVAHNAALLGYDLGRLSTKQGLPQGPRGSYSARKREGIRLKNGSVSKAVLAVLDRDWKSLREVRDLCPDLNKNSVNSALDWMVEKDLIAWNHKPYGDRIIRVYKLKEQTND